MKDAQIDMLCWTNCTAPDPFMFGYANYLMPTNPIRNVKPNKISVATKPSISGVGHHITHSNLNIAFSAALNGLPIQG